MKAMKAIWTLLAADGLALGLAMGSLAGDAHKHDHGAAPAKLELNNGKKWATDAPLRKGMENIRNSIDAVHHEVHENKLSAAKYGELEKKVHGEVEGIIDGCKLDPKADAQLHMVIADILEGVEAMEGKTKKMKRQAGALCATTSQNSQSHCNDGGCCSVEKSQYKSEQQRATLASPIFLPAVLTPILDATHSLPAEVSVGILTAAPPDLPTTWHFLSRTALPARAPSIAS